MEHLALPLRLFHLNGCLIGMGYDLFNEGVLCKIQINTILVLELLPH